MRSKQDVQVVTDTSPSAASTTAVSSTQFKGAMLSRYEKLVIDAALTGGTGGTLDVYLQRKLASDTWRDWVHFPQLAAGASKKYTLVVTGEGNNIIEVGGGTDATPGVALAANAYVNAVPGGDVRIVFVTGGGTSAGASQTIRIQPYTEKH